LGIVVKYCLASWSLTPNALRADGDLKRYATTTLSDADDDDDADELDKDD
jgi:hypothetical protein